MTDPLSVSGSLIGVITLGTQVCQAIITYYNTWRRQDEEVNALLKRTTGLQSLLDSIRPLLSYFELGHEVSTQQVRQCLGVCKSSLEMIKSKLEKCYRTQTPNEPIEKIRMFLHRSLYPLRRDTLFALNDGVTECQRSLQVALNILHLYDS